MRITINLDYNENLTVPYRYFDALQNLVYELLKCYNDVGWLHDTGAKVDKRTYKPLVYSHLTGRRWTKKYNWIYAAPSTITISSPFPQIIDSIKYQIDKRAYYRFLGKTIIIQNYNITDTETITSNEFKALSPIVISTPVLLPSGKIYQKYISVFEKEYNTILKNNLINKAKTFYDIDLKGDCMITPLFKDDSYCHTFYYKDSAIKGWSGRFKFEGNKEFLYIANNCGLGCKNAIGFGLIELINN